jgi:hypothetical protein
VEKANRDFLEEAGRKLDDALGDAKECELKLNAIARKGNSQTGVTETDRKECWRVHEELTEKYKAMLSSHNTKLDTIDAVAAAKTAKLETAALAEDGATAAALEAEDDAAAALDAGHTGAGGVGSGVGSGVSGHTGAAAAGMGMESSLFHLDVDNSGPVSVSGAFASMGNWVRALAARRNAPTPPSAHAHLPLPPTLSHRFPERCYARCFYQANAARCESNQWHDI